MKINFWKILHWFLIINFVVEILYSAYQLFFVVGGGGPLFYRAQEISFELLVKRRLYAIETLIAIAGLSIYLAITEITPRMKKEHNDARP
jgi:hypothetical protein